MFSVWHSTVLIPSRCSKNFFLLCKLYEDRGWIHLHLHFIPRAHYNVWGSMCIIKWIPASHAPENAGLAFYLQPLWLADKLLRQSPVPISQFVFHFTFAADVSAAVLVSTILRVIDLSLHNATHFLVFPFGIWVTALRFRPSACGGNLKIWNATARVA